MRQSFRSYQIAVEFYRAIAPLRLSAHIKQQLLRSAASSAANLAEGYGKSSPAEQARYFEIAYASCKESQSWLELSGRHESQEFAIADRLGAHIYRLMKSCRR